MDYIAYAYRDATNPYSSMGFAVWTEHEPETVYEVHLDTSHNVAGGCSWRISRFDYPKDYPGRDNASWPAGERAAREHLWRVASNDSRANIGLACALAFARTRASNPFAPQPALGAVFNEALLLPEQEEIYRELAWRRAHRAAHAS